MAFFVLEPLQAFPQRLPSSMAFLIAAVSSWNEVRNVWNASETRTYSLAIAFRSIVFDVSEDLERVRDGSNYEFKCRGTL